MKYFFLLVCTISISIVHGQILTFDHGKVEFHTSSIMSDIEAISEDIELSLDLESSTVDLRIAINSFEFEYEMMQDHFNEEYLESDKYPDATFTGQILQDISNIQAVIEVDITGDMTIHGVTKHIDARATLSREEGLVKVKSIFPIVFKDYNVEEPSILSKSVAKDVEVKCILYLK